MATTDDSPASRPDKLFAVHLPAASHWMALSSEAVAEALSETYEVVEFVSSKRLLSGEDGDDEFEIRWRNASERANQALEQLEGARAVLERIATGTRVMDMHGEYEKRGPLNAVECRKLAADALRDRPTVRLLSEGVGEDGEAAALSALATIRSWCDDNPASDEHSGGWLLASLVADRIDAAAPDVRDRAKPDPTQQPGQEGEDDWPGLLIARDEDGAFEVAAADGDDETASPYEQGGFTIRRYVPASGGEKR